LLTLSWRVARKVIIRHIHVYLLLALLFNIQAGKSPVSMLSVKYLFSRIAVRILENAL